MIKDLRQQQQQQSQHNLNVVKAGGPAGSMSYASNASTKDALVNEELQRFNLIMHEPIDNLLNNMEELSRPVSQGKLKNNAMSLALRMGGQQSGFLKKERASTANNRQYNSHNMTKNNIALSAYNIKKDAFSGNMA
jgi:hypothetical protein